MLRFGLASSAVLLVLGLAQATGDWVSEDNDMLVYFGTLILASLYLGRGPALLACALTLLVLSLGQGHSGFQIRTGKFQVLLSFALFVFATHQVSRLAEQVRKEAWRARQKAQVMGLLRDFGRECSHLTTPQEVADLLTDWLERRLQVPAGDEPFWGTLGLSLRNQAQAACERLEQNEAHRRASVLQATQELQSTLISCMSHDLQTPLSSILGTFEMLTQPGHPLTSEQAQQLLQIGHGQAQRLLHLTRNLLNLSKLEGGGLRLAQSRVDLGELLQSAVKVLDPPDQQRVIVNGSSSSEVRGDAVLLTQVLVNLLDNALKFGPPDLAVQVGVCNELDQIDLHFENQGAGVLEEEAEKIFERFYRGSNIRQVPGSGLGLYLCRKIIVMHGGSLKLDTQWQGGTRFTLTLPKEVNSDAWIDSAGGR